MRLLGDWNRVEAQVRLIWGCALGLLSLAVMTSIVLAMESLWSVDTSEVTMLLPVVVASLFGLIPGLITTVVAAVLVDFFILSPPGAWPPATVDDVLILVSFTGLALIVSTLVAALSRARWRYQRLVEAAPMPIIQADAKQRVMAANPVWEALFGQASERLLGRSLPALLGPDRATGAWPWRRMSTPGGEISVQEVRAPLPNGQGEVCILQDVTAQATMLELKEDFLIKVAHELRTPVTAQSALLELLASAETLAGNERGLVANALAASHRLEALIEGVLDLKSIRAGEFQVERAPVALQQIIAEAVATTEPLLGAREQRVALRLPRRTIMVGADRRRLVQVMVNLLSNASRYGPDHQTVTVSAAASNHAARVTVRNRVMGGVAQEHRTNGLGLGLSISEAIVTAHDGTLTVEIGLSESVAELCMPLLRGSEPA